MNKPLKAALFSALLFPGAGQLLLKKYTSAMFYAVFAFIGLYLLLSNLLARVQDIIAQIERGEIALDIAAITELVQQQTATATDSLSPAVMIFVIAWLVSVIEAYRVAKKCDRQ